MSCVPAIARGERGGAHGTGNREATFSLGPSAACHNYHTLEVVSRCLWGNWGADAFAVNMLRETDGTWDNGYTSDTRVDSGRFVRPSGHVGSWRKAVLAEKPQQYARWWDWDRASQGAPAAVNVSGSTSDRA
eukprot:6860379-Prymnesium_polylepis.1